MKTTTLFTAILLTSMLSIGQNPSITISHNGLSPYDTLTVYVGDSVDFFYGGGGSHPMTEGWQSGQTSSPISFPTQTVTSSIPSVTFTLDTPGTYYFHCGTNPGNSNNWGKITVLDTTATEIIETEIVEYKIYPNPSTDVITIEGLNGAAEIYNLIGEKVMDVNSSIINVYDLLKGVYIIKIEEYNATFIKN
jgi:plastocyanin